METAAVARMSLAATSSTKTCASSIMDFLESTISKPLTWTHNSESCSRLSMKLWRTPVPVWTPCQALSQVSTLGTSRSTTNPTRPAILITSIGIRQLVQVPLLCRIELVMSSIFTVLGMPYNQKRLFRARVFSAQLLTRSLVLQLIPPVLRQFTPFTKL